MSAKWRVERAGGPNGEYLRGWLAIDQNGNGYFKPTWAEAMDCATSEADDAFARDMRKAATDAQIKIHQMRLQQAAAQRKAMTERAVQWLIENPIGHANRESYV
ncbi:MAG: hypothetical protein ABWY36_06305 [Leifsonia sp.]